MGVWAGMNYYAARKLKYKPKIKKDEIHIDRALSLRKRRETIKHEIVEAGMMRKGASYKAAHRVALKYEKKLKRR